MLLNTIDANDKTYRKPKRFFEDTGVVNPGSSYFAPLDNVTNTKNQEIQTMIDRGRYFSIFAPRQSGKTTFIKEICRQLHGDPTYVAVLLSFQKYKNLDKTQFYQLVEKTMYSQLIDRLSEVKCEKSGTVKQFLDAHHLTDHISFSTLFEELNHILRFKKIVIFIDEFDGIPLIELENFLSTLRDLYQAYKDVEQKALYSVGLIGIRNITKLVVGGVSPFNIADNIKLPPFSLKNVRELYTQYTEETNQPFTEDAVKKVYAETNGQTWLVNRLGTILTVNIKPNTVEPIDEHDVDRAVQLLLSEKNSHFDNLYEKAKLYKETFVEIVFDNVAYNPDDDDQSWLEQYGLIRQKNEKAVAANNIYKARYIKTFFKEVNASGNFPLNEYELPGNRLDMARIILNFNHYIAQIGVKAFYEEKKTYEKTGQFLLTAFLYQFSGKEKGELHCELRTGLGIMDIILSYKSRKYIIETKVNRSGNYQSVLNEGVIQLTQKYLSTEAVADGYLVIFDTATAVGTECKPKSRRKGNKKINIYIIGIGRSPAPQEHS
ncbi:MAG: hypothetical protein QG657_3636 [Acidobacteriota bacterium]|nr:hypothetical protein [Acidobacteriota bacterium]